MKAAADEDEQQNCTRKHGGFGASGGLGEPDSQEEDGSEQRGQKRHQKYLISRTHTIAWWQKVAEEVARNL